MKVQQSFAVCRLTGQAVPKKEQVVLESKSLLSVLCANPPM